MSALEETLARLARERDEADRAYNDALTALDRAIASPVTEFPHPPPEYDTSQLSAVNAAWETLPQGAPAIDGSLKGRLRGFIWRLVGPALMTQRQFNAALVDHLNRNVATHVEAAKAATSTIALLRAQIETLQNFQAHLIRYLQTVTLYVDTKDRAVGGQSDVLNAGLSAVADDWLKRWESLTAREHRIAARVAANDDVRATATLAQQTALALKRDVEQLLRTIPAGANAPGVAEAPAAPDLDSFKYLGFEDQFRGSQDDIRARLAEYVPLFEGQRDVLDIGCGRGEFLDLLRTARITARGLDINDAMVAASRERGLDVTKGDALEYLTSLPDASLGGLFAAQVVEHLPPAYLSSLIGTAAHKMRPDGRMVLETINPACWLAFFESYIRDLTHVRPLHPETLQYLVRVSGFHDVTIAFKAPVPGSARLQPVPAAAASATPAEIDLVDTFNENVAKLNSRMFTYQDYAIVARR
jgi:SAM-dependent methyltransferase